MADQPTHVCVRCGFTGTPPSSGWDEDGCHWNALGRTESVCSEWVREQIGDGPMTLLHRWKMVPGEEYISPPEERCGPVVPAAIVTDVAELPGDAVEGLVRGALLRAYGDRGEALYERWRKPLWKNTEATSLRSYNRQDALVTADYDQLELRVAALAASGVVWRGRKLRGFASATEVNRHRVHAFRRNDPVRSDDRRSLCGTSRGRWRDARADDVRCGTCLRRVIAREFANPISTDGTSGA